jgi:hypothetical protein
LGPEYQPQQPQDQQQLHLPSDMLLGLNTPLLDPNAGQPNPNAPLLPLGAFDMPLLTMPPNFGDFGLPQSPMDFSMPQNGLQDWMAAPENLITPAPDAQVSGSGVDGAERTPAVINTPEEEGSGNVDNEQEDPRDSEEEEESGPAIAPSKARRSRAPAARHSGSAGGAPAKPAAKPARPKPKPAYRGAAVGPTAANTPQSQKDSGGVAQDKEGGEKDDAAGDKEGGGEDDEDPDAVWRHDTSEWPQELRNALSAFARGKSWGGEQWKDCVTGLVALERAWGFPAKGPMAAPNTAGDRPKEIPDFMQAGRKWASPVELQSICGPSNLEESFARRWWNWWGTAQPSERRKADGKLGDALDVPASGWEEIGKMCGRNGLLLFVGGLFWWGEAAAAAADCDLLLDDWREAVEDVTAVMKEAVKDLHPM